ncbi:MAG: hypothetical protein WB643_09335 [Candidatus Bathyarchaeia archaeon]
MASKNEAELRRRRPSVKGIVALLVLVILVLMSAWTLVTVSKISQIWLLGAPPSTFVNLPTTPLSNHGQTVLLVSISTISQKGVAVGMKGYLDTTSGQPVAGAKIYVQYYLNGAYQTQVSTTGQDGYFEIHFPMNWTGSLPVTFTYFGDDQYQGLRLNSSLPGEGL